MARAGYFVLLTQLDAGAKRSEAGARIRTGAFGARGGLEMEVKGGAGWDLGGRRSEWLVDDLRLSGFAEDDGVNLQFALESGLERKIKMGLLRPTKPTLAAYRLRVDIDPHSGRGDPRGSRPHYGATQRPDVSTAGEWRLGGEWGYAAGDVWSCRVKEKTAAYVTQGGRISSSVTRSDARSGWRRADRNGARLGSLRWSSTEPRPGRAGGGRITSRS